MEEDSQKTSSDIKVDSLSKSDPTVKQSQQAIKSSTSKQYKKPLVVVGVLLGFVLFGVEGYILGLQRGGQINTTNDNITPIQTPVTTIQPSPINTPVDDSSAELLEPKLVSIADWKTVSFPQDIRVSQGGDVRPAKIEMMIPPDWTTETVQTRTGEQIGGGICNDFQLSNASKDVLLIIKPACGDSNNDYLPISGKVQKVELITNKGNDGHDSYTVRYYDSSTQNYHYGSIGVSPGARIDIQNDQIYPNLVLQYEPDRDEQWLWTSYDLTYSGVPADQDTALSTADTIISTLKLTD